MLPSVFRSLFVPATTRVAGLSATKPVLNSALKWQVVRYPLLKIGAEQEGEFNYASIRGSRPAVISGKYLTPKKLKHRQSVEKRILHLQREAAKMKRERELYAGVKKLATSGALPPPVHLRAAPRRIPSNEEIEFHVKRREMRRLLPFKKAANTKQWRMLSNNDKRVDDDTIEALQRYKAAKEANPQAKPEPGPLE